MYVNSASIKEASDKDYIPPNPKFNMTRSGSLNVESALLLVVAGIAVLLSAALIFYLGVTEGGKTNFILNEIIPHNNNDPGMSPVGFQILSGSPQGILPADLKQVNLSITTSQNAICKYSIVPGKEYSDMPLTFKNSGGITHTSKVLTLSNRENYIYYVKCADQNGMLTEGEHVISFDLSGYKDDKPPSMFSAEPSGTLENGITTTTISIKTNEKAECRYSSTANKKYNDMQNNLTASNGTSHNAQVSKLTLDKKYLFYVKCKDSAGNETANDLIISFNTISVTPPINVPSEMPVIFNGTVNGISSKAYLSNNATDLEFRLKTNDNATCRYSTSPGNQYEQMTGSFDEINSTQHTVNLSGYSEGDTGTLYVRCNNDLGKPNDTDFLLEYSIERIIQIAIANGNDDIFNFGETGSWQGFYILLTGNYLDQDSDIFFVWKLPIPAKSRIDTAYITLTSSQGIGELNTYIKLLDPSGSRLWENSAGFSSSNYPSGTILDSVSVIEPGVFWRISDIIPFDETFNSEDISELVSEFVNRTDYSSNNYLGIKIDFVSSVSGELAGRQVSSYEGPGSREAVLVIGYHDPD